MLGMFDVLNQSTSVLSVRDDERKSEMEVTVRDEFIPVFSKQGYKGALSSERIKPL